MTNEQLEEIEERYTNKDVMYIGDFRTDILALIADNRRLREALGRIAKGQVDDGWNDRDEELMSMAEDALK